MTKKRDRKRAEERAEEAARVEAIANKLHELAGLGTSPSPPEPAPSFMGLGELDDDPCCPGSANVLDEHCSDFSECSICGECYHCGWERPEHSPAA